MSKRCDSSRSVSRPVPLTAAQASLLESARERGTPTDFRVPVRGGTANALRALTRRGLIDHEGAITPEGTDALLRYRLREAVVPGE
jgi:hypothetical protein